MPTRMNWKPILRLAADLGMVALIAWAPLWVGAVAALASAWAFAPYYEILAWGLAYGSLYGMRDWRGAVIAFAVIVLIELLRKRFRIA